MLAGCGEKPPLQLWYWHHSYLTSAEALAKSKLLAERAAAAGYTGVALWDSSLIFLSEPGWPAKNVAYVGEFVRYARGKGLTVMGLAAPYGHSGDVLKAHPEWAEGQRVSGAAGKEPVTPLGRGRFAVRPWRQYRVTFLDGRTGPVGAIDADDRKSARMEGMARPDAREFVFNSAESRRVKIFGPGRFVVEETAYVGMVGGHEGHAGGDYYSALPANGEGVGMCLTNAETRAWVRENARRVAQLVDGPLFLQYDEMRHLNSCALCAARKQSAGALLAENLRQTVASLPPRRLYVWSDMFDPWHNAVDHYGFAEGSVAGSWEGLPRQVTVMNWNLGHLRASLEWFAARGNPQVIAGYYDPPDGQGYAAARRELSAANGVRGIAGAMFTTWTDNYSQLESYADGARAQWREYQAALPW